MKLRSGLREHSYRPASNLNATSDDLRGGFAVRLEADLGSFCLSELVAT